MKNNQKLKFTSLLCSRLGYARAQAAAKYLVNSGAFLPPCKIGDRAYFVIEDTDDVYISNEAIVDVSVKGFFVGDDPEVYLYEQVGKDVFLSQKACDKELLKVLRHRKKKEK